MQSDEESADQLAALKGRGKGKNQFGGGRKGAGKKGGCWECGVDHKRSECAQFIANSSSSELKAAMVKENRVLSLAKALEMDGQIIMVPLKGSPGETTVVQRNGAKVRRIHLEASGVQEMGMQT